MVWLRLPRIREFPKPPRSSTDWSAWGHPRSQTYWDIRKTSGYRLTGLKIFLVCQSTQARHEISSLGWLESLCAASLVACCFLFAIFRGCVGFERGEKLGRDSGDGV